MGPYHPFNSRFTTIILEHTATTRLQLSEQKSNRNRSNHRTRENKIDQAIRPTGKQPSSRTVMSSRDLVPYGHGREPTRDLVSYESGRASLHPLRDSMKDSRAYQATARGQTSLRDHHPYGTAREFFPHFQRESSWESSQTSVRSDISDHDDHLRGSERMSIRPGRELTRDFSPETARGHRSHHDDYPRGSERLSIRPGRESRQDSSPEIVRGHTSRHDHCPRGIERVSIRPGRESTKTSAYPSSPGHIPHIPHQTSSRRDSRTNTKISIPKETADRLGELKEAYYSNDGKTITQRARYSNLTKNTTTEFEVRETPTSLTRIRRTTHASNRSPDVHSNDKNLISSRDTPRGKAGGYRSSHDECRSSTRR